MTDYTCAVSIKRNLLSLRIQKQLMVIHFLFKYNTASNINNKLGSKSLRLEQEPIKVGRKPDSLTKGYGCRMIICANCPRYSETKMACVPTLFLLSIKVSPMIFLWKLHIIIIKKLPPMKLSEIASGFLILVYIMGL